MSGPAVPEQLATPRDFGGVFLHPGLALLGRGVDVQSAMTQRIGGLLADNATMLISRYEVRATAKLRAGCPLCWLGFSLCRQLDSVQRLWNVGRLKTCKAELGAELASAEGAS